MKINYNKNLINFLFIILFIISPQISFSQCYNGTVNRHAGTWHSNLYIGASKNSSANYLVAWGESSQLLTTGSGTVYCVPTIVPSSNYIGIPIEVRAASSDGRSGFNIFVLRTEDLTTPANNKIYLYGDGTLPASFGASGLPTSGSEFSAKIPSGVTMADIAFVKVSPISLAIVTKTSGNVYITSIAANSTSVLFGDNLGAASNGNNWHKVLTASGTALSGVTKLSLSAGGALALSGTNVYFFGKNGYIPTSNSTIAKVNTTYAKLLNDPNLTTPYFPTLVSGETTTDVVCLGDGTATTNLYFLTSKGRVYVNGSNAAGELGNGSATSVNQSTFVTVTFPAEVNNSTNPIVKIDGSTESSTDVTAMGAMDQNGNLFTWGDNDGSMIGGASTYYVTPKKINFEPNATLTANTSTVIPINDFTIGGHFSCAFDNTNDAYWYLGHFKTASMGALGNDPLNSNAAYCTEDINQQYFFRVDNTSIDFGFNCSNAIPTATVSTTNLSGFSTCSGLASSEKSFTVSGVNLLSDISIAAPTGYEISLTSGGPFTSSPSLTITPTSGTVITTTIYVRLKSNATNGASGNIEVSSTNAATQNVASGTGVVNALPSSLTGTDGSRNGTGTVTISGAVTTGETIDWYANSSGGSPLSGGTGTTSFTTPSISSTTIYYAQARNTTTGCVSTSRTAVTATVQSNATPSISTSGTLSAFTACSGTVSSEQNFSVSGINLVSNITITAPTGYEVSLTSGGTFTDSVALTPSSNTVSSTTIYVRLKNNASNGATGNVVCSATNAISVDVSTGTAVINALPSSPTGTNGSRIGTGTVDISGSVTTGETIDWYANSSGGSPLSGGTATTSFTTPSISSTTIYYAQARNTTTGCVSTSRTAVTATVLIPTISTSGTLSAFTACVGTVSSEQNFSVSGINLVSNITITAPTGYEVSLTSGGTFTDSVDLMPTSNTVSTTTIYIRLKSNASNGASGNVVCSATSAASENVSVGTATVNALPSISVTLTLCVGATTQLTGSATAAVSSAWVSATTGVATISGTGLVTGQSSGTSLITYTNSNGCIITSTVTVNALPSITLASSATDVAYDVNGQNTSITYSGATGSPTTYSIAWNSSPSNSFVAVSDANLTSSPISLAIPAGTAVGTYTGTFTVKNVLQCTNSYSFTVKINDVTAPIITHPTSTTLNTCSLTLSENTSGVTIYTANESVTWSITGGDDQAKFSISPTGSLTFIAPYPIHAYPTDTAPTNSYIVEITATDAAGNYSRQLLTVNISPFCGNWGN